MACLEPKYYLRTKFQDGIDKPQKGRNVCYHPTHQSVDNWGEDHAGGKGVCGRLMSPAGDPFHAGGTALTRETPAQRGRLTGMRWIKDGHH
jgi:hypothetical protein